MDDLRRLWEPISLHTGLFEGFLITANKFAGTSDTIAWHLRVQPNSGGFLHGYWFTDNEFFDIGRQFVTLEGSNSLETGPPISPPSGEESAMRKALEAWKQ